MSKGDLGVKHHFGGGVYVKETQIPAGYALVQHKHKFEHLSILASGQAVVGEAILAGPAVVTIEAGRLHRVKALTDCVWLCVHATGVVDVGMIDETLIIPSTEAEIMKVAQE